MKTYLMVVEVEDQALLMIEEGVNSLHDGIAVKQLMPYQEPAEHSCSCDECLQFRQQNQWLAQEYADERAAHNERVRELLEKEKELQEVKVFLKSVMDAVDDLLEVAQKK